MVEVVGSENVAQTLTDVIEGRPSTFFLNEPEKMRKLYRILIAHPEIFGAYGEGAPDLIPLFREILKLLEHP